MYLIYAEQFHFRDHQFFRFFAKIWIVFFTVFTLNGCGVSDSDISKAKNIINSQSPGLESSVQAAIQAHPDFSSIIDGEWKWQVVDGEASETLDATYGYLGRNSWWKVALGGLIGGIVLVLTVGMVWWFPWSGDASISKTFVVDLVNQTVTPKPAD